MLFIFLRTILRGDQNSPLACRSRKKKGRVKTNFWNKVLFISFILVHSFAKLNRQLEWSQWLGKWNASKDVGPVRRQMFQIAYPRFGGSLPQDFGNFLARTFQTTFLKISRCWCWWAVWVQPADLKLFFGTVLLRFMLLDIMTPQLSVALPPVS